MRCLEFERRGGAVNGKVVRSVSFRERSVLPLSAACVVAAGVRETLGGLFGEPVLLKLYEPVIPSADAWEKIARNAAIQRIRTSRGDGAIVLRPSDATALAAAAFGEKEPAATELSGLERAVIERTVRAISAHVVTIFGVPEAPQLEETHSMVGFTTFFELQVERPVRARIGIALAREPRVEPQPGIDVDDLLGLQVDLAVRADLGSHAALLLAQLEPGAMLPLPEFALRGTLHVAGRLLAGGECGVNGGRYALAIDHIQTRRDEPAQ
jgi:hypothetical protein